MIVDTHSHLYYPELKSNLDEILKRAQDIGIEKIIIPSVNIETIKEIIDISDKYEIIYTAVGIHPTEVKNSQRKHIKLIEEYLQHPKVVAIGEIGLDFYWDKSNIDEQKYFFEEQINIAIEYDLPIIIHTRNSIEDTIELLNKEAYINKIKGQFHCFSGNKENLEKILSNDNFFISFCGNITYKNYKKTEIIKSIPPQKLLFETYSPFMSPIQIKNKINEPANIIYTIKSLSEILNIEYDSLIEIVYNNSYKLFKKLKGENKNNII